MIREKFTMIMDNFASITIVVSWAAHMVQMKKKRKAARLRRAKMRAQASYTPINKHESSTSMTSTTTGAVPTTIVMTTT